MKRDPYPIVGAAHRAAIDRAHAAEFIDIPSGRSRRLARLDFRVLNAVLSLTISWSRLEDRLYLAQIAAIAFNVKNPARWQRSRTGESLARLNKCGVIRYRPGAPNTRGLIQVPQAEELELGPESISTKDLQDVPSDRDRMSPVKVTDIPSTGSRMSPATRGTTEETEKLASSTEGPSKASPRISRPPNPETSDLEALLRNEGFSSEVIRDTLDKLIERTDVRNPAAWCQKVAMETQTRWESEPRAHYRDLTELLS